MNKQQCIDSYASRLLKFIQKIRFSEPTVFVNDTSLRPYYSSYIYTFIKQKL